MIKTCIDGHAKIGYETENCPMCVSRRVNSEQFLALEKELDEMNKLLDDMAHKNHSMKEKCICGKLAE
jgi:hypothetical protein